MNTKPILTIFLLIFGLFVARTQTIDISGDSQPVGIEATTATVIAPNLTITSSTAITDFTVSITNSFTATDQLGYNGMLPSGVTTSGWNSGTRSIVFKGSLSASEWQTFLRNVTMTSGPICSPETRQVTFVAEETFYNPLNGHFYRLTDTQTSWTATKLAASSLSYFGREAYLVTLTSNAENIFVTRIVGENSWMGSSDDHNQINEALGYNLYANTNASEGKFYWVTGPEKGTQLTTNNGTGNGIPGVYQNWRSGEPNDYNNGSPGESFGHVYSNQGDWNDFPDTSSIFGIIEFGDMPNDQISATPFFTKDITINGAPGGNITGGEVSVCSGSNSTTLTLNGLNGSVVRWESSDNNFIDTPTAISNTTTTLTVNNISTTTYYRAIVNTNAPTNCSNLITSSTPIFVKEADAGNVFAQNTIICAGSTVELFVSGQEGSVQKWERSNDNINWVDIANTTTTLEEAIASTGSWYYRVVTEISECGTTDISDAKEITVVSGTPPVGGQVSSAVHNSTSNGGTITLTGQTGTIEKWQQSTDNGIIWSDIANTNSTYTYSNIAETTLFRAVIVNGSCGTANSDTGSVTVDTDAPAGYSVVIDQNPIDTTNENTISFTFSGAEIGATFNYTFISDGGGTPVVGSGTIATTTDQITSIDLSGLSDGTITLSTTLTDSVGNEGNSYTDNATKETDVDDDGLKDDVDNCPTLANADQLNTDGDSEGDVCDDDDDNDGTLDSEDDFPLDENEDTDTDGDGTGDNADNDDDNDGTLDSEDDFPLDENEDTDTDGDGTGDNADTDDDGDGTLDTEDDFPLDENEDTDTDGDGTGDNTDIDDDGDGTPDADDDFPLDENEDTDTDGDGNGDNADDDDDGDGTPDTEDDFPLDETEDADFDGDGIGDNADTDDDNDGIPDSDDSEPNNSTDSDNDGIPDSEDDDDDNDGVQDSEDDFPLDENEDTDTDGDGTGDNSDEDDDGDGTLDVDDDFPLDENEDTDSDADGVGDNVDTDDDNDGIADLQDDFPNRSEPSIVPAQAFTPNGDGVNDSWMIPGIDNYFNTKVTVYNRWGHEVFTAVNYRNDWQGNYNSNSDLLPSGSYLYVIDLGNGTVPIRGWIFINY